MSNPISRWFRTERLSRNVYSIGSSTRPGDQHDAAGVAGEVEHGLRQVETVERRHLGRDQTQHHADRSALLEQVDAITHPVGRAVGEIDVQVLLEVRALPVVHHVDRELRDRFAGQRWYVAHRPQVPLDPENWR
ncbi:MAG: hypothetical protein E6J90_47015 [Deltaproteobacteria bacterium]|nr:MAG: hypothetical protein E6J90_47015 [Deltaproteobacteria bacterium]